MACVKLEKLGHMGMVSINRPDALNALNSQVLMELEQILDQIESDAEIYVLVITGTGLRYSHCQQQGQIRPT